jgi:hypothetical protein
MSFFIGAIGAATVVISFVGVLFPDVILRAVEGVKPSPRLHALSVVRLTIGVIFVIGATSTAFPDLIRLLGVVVILRGLAIPVLGPERVRALIDRQLGRSPVVLRVLLLPATALGGFLVWAALQ